MGNLPHVSVVIPTCDRPRFLQEALGSVAAQHHLPQEVIVVDDGEMAGAVGEVCSSLPVRVVPGPRRGPASARNAGISAATGELVAFLDDDDLWRPEKLELQMAWFARRPALGLLGTGVVRGPGPAWRRRELRRRPARLRAVGRAALVRANRFVTSSVVVRRECLREGGGFEESLALAQDWDMWLRIAERREMALLPPPLTWYRVHDGQRSASSIEMRRCEVEVLGRAAAREAPAGPLTNLIRRRLAWAQCRLGRALLRERQPEAAAQVLKASVRGNPLGLVAWARLAQSWLSIHGIVTTSP